MGTGVDLSALSAKKARADGNLVVGQAGVKVVDRVALRKSWSRQATYWVDILSDGHVAQVRKSWRWQDGHEVKAGETFLCRPTGNGKTLLDKYTEAVQTQTAKDYVIIERQACSGTPAATLDLTKVGNAHTLALVDDVNLDGIPDGAPVLVGTSPKTKPPVLSRKAERDWW